MSLIFDGTLNTISGALIANNQITGGTTGQFLKGTGTTPIWTPAITTYQIAFLAVAGGGSGGACRGGAP